MEIILHVGAHRTGTSTLQMSINKNKQILNNMGITYWGPTMIRNGLFSGMFRVPTLSDSDELIKTANVSKTNINARIERLAQEGQSKLLLSEENMIGSMETNLGEAELYPDLFMRLAHLSSLFGDNCFRVGLSIRSYDTFWSSSIAFAIKDGFYVPNRNRLINLSYQKRTWRDVIIEISEIFQNAKILVWDFDRLVGKNESIVKILTDTKMDYGFQSLDMEKHNVSCSTSKLRNTLLKRGNIAAAQELSDVAEVYMPFSVSQVDHMQSKFQGDLNWLLNGADGVAQYIESASDIDFQRHYRLNELSRMQNTKPISAKNSNIDKALNTPSLRDEKPPVLESDTDLSRAYFCQNLPLIFGPIPGVPDLGVRNWLRFHNQRSPQNGLSSHRFAEWKAHTKNSAFFSVVRHPVKRAYNAFMKKIFSTTSGGYVGIRQELENQFGMILPQGNIAPVQSKFTLERNGYGLEEHRISFKLFLIFVAANLGNETKIRQDGKWQLQTEIIRRYWILHPDVIVLKEENLALGLKYLENRLNLPADLVWKNEIGSEFSFPLADVYDAEIEALARAAYGQDYDDFNYENWA